MFLVYVCQFLNSNYENIIVIISCHQAAGMSFVRQSLYLERVDENVGVLVSRHQVAGSLAHPLIQHVVSDFQKKRRELGSTNEF
jgi:hypothetical protein